MAKLLMENNTQKSVTFQIVYRIQYTESTLEDVFFQQKALTTKIVTGRTTEALIDSFALQLYEIIQQGD